MEDVVPVAAFEGRPASTASGITDCSRKARHAGGGANITRVRELMAVSTPTPEPVETEEPPDLLPPCPCCGGRMRIIETFECWMQPRAARSNWGAVVTRRGSFPRHAAPANDTSRAHGRAGVVTCADPCRHRRKTPTSAPGYRS